MRIRRDPIADSTVHVTRKFMLLAGAALEHADRSHNIIIMHVGTDGLVQGEGAERHSIGFLKEWRKARRGSVGSIDLKIGTRGNHDSDFLTFR